MIAENPYFHRGPIKEAKHFYNRTRETALALQMVKKGQSVSVFGPRRIGKTSLLFHLADPAIRAENGLALEQSLFIYIDGEMLGGLSRLDILQFLLQETGAQLAPKWVDLPKIADNRSFEQVFRRLVRPDQQLVYLLDEFECLSKNQNLDVTFFSFLRSLTVRYNIAFITASQTSLLALTDEGGQVSSPFFNIFVPIPLSLFNEDEARQIIRQPAQVAGVEFDRSTEDFILDLAGPHPFFLQIACYHAFELWQECPTFDKPVRKQLAEQVQVDLRNHFEYFTCRLSEEERSVLARLLDPAASEASTSIIDSLKQRCLIREHNNRYVLISQTFAHFVRQQIGTTWTATILEGERRMATLLFADVVGFTPMTEQHVPEEILSIMKPALRMFVNVVDRHGGKVAYLGGDSIMALFGVPKEQPNDATRAVRAALEIQSHVTTYARELKQSKGIDFAARVGLDTGVVVLGELGGEQYSEYTALGDAVNLAQRLETFAQPGTVVISEHTYQQAHGWFKTEYLGLIQVKGKSRPVKAYQVLGERERQP